MWGMIVTLSCDLDTIKTDINSQEGCNMGAKADLQKKTTFFFFL